MEAKTGTTEEILSLPISDLKSDLKSDLEKIDIQSLSTVSGEYPSHDIQTVSGRYVLSTGGWEEITIKADKEDYVFKREAKVSVKTTPKIRRLKKGNGEIVLQYASSVNFYNTEEVLEWSDIPEVEE